MLFVCGVGTLAGTTNDGTQQRQSPLQRSLHDRIAIWLPHMVMLAAVIVGTCYLYDSTLKMLLYSALPESHKNGVSFGILWVEEVRLLLFGCPSHNA